MSEIITDKLTGKTSAGDVTITSEGGSATMQLQQGVAKAWCLMEYSSGTPTSADSFNVSSLDDDGTGDVDYNLTNAGSSDNLSCTAIGKTSANNTILCTTESSSSIRTLQRQSGTNVDHDNSMTMHGDLA